MVGIGSHVYVYRCKKTVVRTVYGNSSGFEVKELACTQVQH